MHTYTPLCQAAMAGDLNRTISFLDAGADTEGRSGETQRTPLMVAAEEGHGEIVKLLLERGAEVDAVDARLRTALMWAAECGKRLGKSGVGVEVVRVLLEHGADPNHPMNELGTPLMWAVYGGNLEAVRVLIDAGARINTVALGGDTALTWAVVHDHLDIVEFLLTCGATANVIDEYGDTPLTMAAYAGNVELVSLLLAKGALADFAGGDGGTTALQTAILHPHTNVIAVLLESGADPNLPDKYGETPLMAALSDEDAVRLMLAHGADVNLRNNKGWSVLEQAHRECCHEAIPLLVEAGAKM